MIRQNLETWSLQWVNDQILTAYIQFLYEMQLCRGNTISEILYRRLKKIIRGSGILDDKKQLIYCWAEHLSKKCCL